MAKWAITFLYSDTFSMLNPLEEENRFTRVLEAPTAAQAVHQFHRDRGFVFKRDIKGVLPVVWEIKQV